MYKIDDEQNIYIVRGDTALIDITVYDIDEHGQKTEHTLEEGEVLELTVKENTKTEDVLIHKTGTSIRFDPEDTEGKPYGKYKYDVQFTGADGFVDTIIGPCNFTITEEVTW